MFLKNIKVEFISLVHKGANRKSVIWKSAERDPREEREIQIAKTDEEKRLVYGIVYSPDEVDTQGDHTNAGEIEKAAHDFMKAARVGNIDKDHSFEAEEGAFVAESWIVKAGDPVFPDEKEGAWAVAIKIEDDELWSGVKKGEIGGLSIGGYADKIAKAVDFNAALTVDGFWQYFNSLERAIKSVIEDDSITDKKAAVAENIDQFKATVVENVTKSQGDGLLAKLKRLIKREEQDMDEKQVKEIATAAVTEAIEKMAKPIRKEDLVTTVVAATKEIVKPIEARLEAIEKQTPGSGQGEGELDDKTDYQALGAEIVKAYKGEV
ncbi:XkdF-like putative serine protease domain-containing protein [Desulforhopalus singaporensis]|uniref:Putative phage serine protease XkdF n=1 Tax=Desulforhopalus singaporensis TaxID=91360 RepID=A0A1H0VEL7_9BACT|nr:XkdF-like putative serine protease domain-containing protein [Desulforhopalus singaporensis]SDP77019.1 Putative phage serine protease XkdF [Desulforhopalus singaporensis]